MGKSNIKYQINKKGKMCLFLEDEVAWSGEYGIAKVVEYPISHPTARIDHVHSQCEHALSLNSLCLLWIPTLLAEFMTMNMHWDEKLTIDKVVKLCFYGVG